LCRFVAAIYVSVPYFVDPENAGSVKLPAQKPVCVHKLPQRL
jgi:hypothetical protein